MGTCGWGQKRCQRRDPEMFKRIGQQTPGFLAPGTKFLDNSFSMDQGWRGGLGMIQTHHIYCALYFHYYYINSSSDHQALDSGGWGPQCRFWHSRKHENVSSTTTSWRVFSPNVVSSSQHSALQQRLLPEAGPPLVVHGAHIHAKWSTWGFFKDLFYWSIVDLHCCVNFCSTAKWFTLHTHTYS